MMSQRRWGWLLLGLCAFSLLAGKSGGFARWRIGSWGVPAAFAWAALVWIFALFSPSALRWHPAAGAWIGWVLWTGISCVLSGDPRQGLEALAWDAAAVCVFILAHAWWGGAHRRAWILGLWGMSPLAVFLWPTDQAVCLLSAAAAASAGIWMGPLAGLPARWRLTALAAGTFALAFVLLYGSWGACFGFFLAAALCAAYSSRKGDWMVPSLLSASVVLWLLLLYWGKIPGGEWLHRAWNHAAAGLGAGFLPADATGPLAPYLLRLAAGTGWVGLGLYACAALASLPGNFKSLGWEGRAGAGALYALFAQSFINGVPGTRPLQIVLFSAIACASNWARAHEESGVSRLVEERIGWIKPAWAGAIGFGLCLSAAAVQRSQALAMAATGSPQPQARIAALERLADLEPLNAGARVRLARELLFAQPSRVGAPLRRLDEAIRLDPRNPMYLGLKAELFAMAGDWERSGEWAEQAVAAEPRFPEAHLMAAESLLHRGDREAALQRLILAKRIHDSFPAGRSGTSIWDQQRYDRLLEALKQGFSNRPRPSRKKGVGR